MSREKNLMVFGLIQIVTVIVCANTELEPVLVLKKVHVDNFPGGNWTKLDTFKNESVKASATNESVYRLIQKERFETDSDGEIEPEDEESSPAPVPATQRPQPLIIKSHPILTSSPISSSVKQPKPSVIKKNPDSMSTTTSKIPVMMMSAKDSPSQNLNQQLSSSSQLKSQLDDLFAKVTSFPHPTQLIPAATPGSEGFYQSFQYIKDAYFEVLEKFRDFRNTVSKRFEMIESQIEETRKMLNKTIIQPPLIPQPIVSTNMDNLAVQAMYIKISEMERRYNMSRLVDHCVHFMLSNKFEEAITIWTKIEMMTASNLVETNENLRDIITLAYAQNNSNTSPVFPFLRRLHGVEKTRLYDFLINGMKAQDNFDGSEIFHIAQYLKERNAVRSSIYSKIPKAVQYAVSGRNVNIVYHEKRSGRNYMHVRDDQNRKDRLNFYIQASQSYSDSRSAVWNIDFTSSSETFRIKNSLYGDYMYVNEEGFLETIPPSNTAPHISQGIEFNFILKKSTIILVSKSYANEPLVVIRGGGKFPFYFSLMRENPSARIAEFLVEPDTLL